MSKISTAISDIKTLIEKNKKVLIGISVAIIIILIVLLGYIIKVNKNVNSWKNKIYPGVEAYGVELGGKTEEEAIDILNTKLSSLIGEKTINVTVGDKNFSIKYSELNPTISAKETAKEAIEYGHTGSIFKEYSLIKNAEKHHVETNLQFDEEKLKEFENKVVSETTIPAVDAKISIASGQISITPEVIGKKIDSEELHNKLVASINPNPESSETINAELKDYSPKVTAEALKKIDGVIGSYTDTYTNNGSGRVTNMEIATGYINGTVLMPGEEFSYNKTIKDTTPENGYKEANTYVGSQVVPGYGGGVCQISTALYRAVMRANIRSTIRYNHSMMVGYAAASLDATVAEGDIDYRFINTYDFPIYIQGYMTGNTIVFNVYGNKEAMGNKTYDLVNEVLETIPYTTEEVKDNTLEEGKKVTEMGGTNGYKSKGYLVTYENGVEVNRELISNDIYYPLNAKVRVGTKKVTQAPQTNTNQNNQGQENQANQETQN